MTFKELFEVLKKVGIPVAYDHFDNYTKLPFMVYRDTGTHNLFADEKTYKQLVSIDLELYFVNKNPSLEQKLYQVLEDHDITWEASGDIWINDEKCYMKVYELGVIING